LVGHIFGLIRNLINMNDEVAQLEFMAQFQFILSEDITLQPG
jgi:hypothetical protein